MSFFQVMFTIDMNFRPENNRERVVTLTFGKSMTSFSKERLYIYSEGEMS